VEKKFPRGLNMAVEEKSFVKVAEKVTGTE